MAGFMADSKSQSWCTPEWILERVRQVFGGQIHLDPCGNGAARVDALHELRGQSDLDDGLAERWERFRNVFCNPPFGKGVDRWMAKAEETGKAGVEVILLVPAFVSRHAWHDHVASAEAICFLRGRVKFLGAESCAPFATALVYWGHRPWAFREAFADRGMVIKP
jgi:site-specific DNA-methyltransferase (adenine-specific)